MSGLADRCSGQGGGVYRAGDPQLKELFRDDEGRFIAVRPGDAEITAALHLAAEN